MKRHLWLFLCLTACLYHGSTLALQDQGLISILSIIDKATQTLTEEDESDKSNEEKLEALQSVNKTIANLSRTLGNLSYSRLQCGQADVLAEFTQRVLALPENFRDPMRAAFQEGFDQSKNDSPLLSEDECTRLTQSRQLTEKVAEPNVEETPQAEQAEIEKPVEDVEDPKLKHLRLAELTGQLAYKRKFCGDSKVTNRDFNEVIGTMPEEFQEDAKKAYWKGYQHGKFLNKKLDQSACL